MSIPIDGIYVINLDSRPERWNNFSAQSHLWEQTFGKQPQRLRAVFGVQLKGFGKSPWFTKRISEKRRKSWGGKAGCILSHRNALQLAHESQLANVMVVEDDAFLPDDFPEKWQHGLKNLIEELPEDWAVLYFCTTQAFAPSRCIKQMGETKLIESSGALGAVTYLVNGKILPKLLAELPTEETIWPWVARHKTIDRWLSQNLMRFGRVFLFAPSLAGHDSVGSSDTSMTAENDAMLDFSLNDISFCNNSLSFNILRFIRLILNTLKRNTSIARQLQKKVRGL